MWYVLKSKAVKEFNGCAETDGIRKKERLTRLKLDWTRITDDGLRLIGDTLGELKYLSVCGCPNITDEGVRYVLGKCGKSLRDFYLEPRVKVTQGFMDRYTNARGCLINVKQ